MSPNFIQEQLSWAYVRAVVFRAGYRLSLPVVDNYGIDGTVESHGPLGHRVDFQLKATTRYVARDESISYDLRVGNYNELIVGDGMPRVLILYVMSEDDSDWLAQTPQELCLRRCAYWVSLMGLTPSANTSTVRVTIPMANLFDQAGLSNMFSQLVI